jgi:hypothetical protein
VVTRSFSDVAPFEPAPASAASTTATARADDATAFAPLGGWPAALPHWKNPSAGRPLPSPPPSPPLQPHRPKSENEDFMVDLSSLRGDGGAEASEPPRLPPSHPSRLAAAARGSGALRRATSAAGPGRREGGGLARRDPKPSAARASGPRAPGQLPPASSVADSTLSTEYGSI